jgi:predicted lipoprotein
VSAPSTVRGPAGLSTKAKRVILAVVVVVLLVAMALDTKVVGKGSSLGAGPQAFSPAAWGKDNFPKVQAAIEKRAVDASTLAAAVAKSPTAARKKYGIDAGSGAGPEVSIKFTGVVGKGASGIYPVKVAGLPKDLLIRIQTGPAINGTDLRDAPGTVKFGDFTNQIDYQNAASALNAQLKKQVLAKVDTAHLTGKTVSVVGAFQLINPNAWLVTPAKLTVS